MRILGVDTATSTASIAIVENGQILTEARYPREGSTDRSGPKSNHAEIVLPLIDSVLHRTGIGLPDFAGIAVSIGPGSFTGIRIGLSTVKGLAYGTGTPAVGISTLEAIAARVTNFEGIVCPLLDARKNEAYVALFRKDGNYLERMTEDAVVPVLSVFEKLRALGAPMPCLFIGDGVTAYRPLIEKFSDLRIHIAEEQAMPSVAASVARLSERQFVADGAALLGDLVPIYLRRPECESRMKVARK
jgi:tRNA threonylcarbamoyladenosine biosynthesis protein TsaB